MGFTIKEIAELFNNTKGAIRFYEESGLICPKRDKSGNRTYSTDDLFQLYYLKRYSNMGCSIKEINQYFRKELETDLHDLSVFLTNKEAELQKNIEYYQNSLAMLTHYHSTILKCQQQQDQSHMIESNSMEFKEFPEYYYIREDQLNTMAPRLRKEMKEWIQACFPVRLHCFLNLDCSKTERGLILFSKDAKHLGLPIPKEAKHYPAAKVCCKSLRMKSSNCHETLISEATKLVEDLKQLGCHPIDQISFHLVYLHHEQGEEYRCIELIIPLELQS